jgi:hypothetical protein
MIRTKDTAPGGGNRMKRILNCLTGIGILLSLTGCEYREHLTGNYYLTETDNADEELSLSYDLGNGSYIGVVNPTLFAVGYDDEYIIAKNHPQIRGAFTFSRKFTHYYIVPLKYKVHHSPDENRIGPLSEEEFKAKRKELKMSDSLTFTRIFKKLE